MWASWNLIFYPHIKDVESPTNVNQNMLAYIVSRTLLEPYIGIIGSKIKRYKETNTCLDGLYNLIRIIKTSVSSKEGIATRG